jgi:HEAT repeat protein
MATQRYEQVHITKKSKFGAHLGTALLVIVVLGVGGFGHYFYNDDPGLLKHVTDRDELSVFAALVYSRKGVPEAAVNPLRDGLEKGSDSFKKACARALGARKNKDMTAFLGHAATHDVDASVRAAMVDAMAENGDVNIGQFLDKLVQETDSRVRIAVARLIGKLKLDRYIPTLIDMVGASSMDADTARVAKEALDSFLGDGRSFGFNASEWNKWYAGEYD